MAQPALRIYEMDLPRRDEAGSTFHVTFYSPAQNAELKGMILVVHGFDENANRYRMMAKEAMVPAGFALVVPDLPGYGQSVGKAGVTSEQACLDVIDDTIKLLVEQTKGLPLFLYGHSMGGNLALHYLLNQEEQINPDGKVDYVENAKNPFHAAIISSPWLKLDHEPPQFVFKLARLAGKYFPKLTRRIRLSAELLTDDRKVMMDREQDTLRHEHISYRMLADIWQSGQRLLDDACKIHLPLLLMYGGEDHVVSIEAIEELSAKLPNYMNAVKWPDFLHELHNMQERESVYVTMYEYLMLCIKRGRRPVSQVKVQTQYSQDKRRIVAAAHAEEIDAKEIPGMVIGENDSHEAMAVKEMEDGVSPLAEWNEMAVTETEVDVLLAEEEGEENPQDGHRLDFLNEDEPLEFTDEEGKQMAVLAYNLADSERESLDDEEEEKE